MALVPKIASMKHLLFLFAVLFSINAWSQTDSLSDDSSPFKPDMGSWGATVNVSGAIASIGGTPRTDQRGRSLALVRYVINDNFTFRLGVAPHLFSTRVLSTDSVGKDLVERDSSARQASVSFRPGVEYHFAGTKRLDPDVALDAEFGVVGQYSSGSVTNVTDTTGTAKFTRTITEAGGFGVGAQLGIGFNYFLAKQLAIGMEYGMGIQHLVTGGDRQEVLQGDPVSGSPFTIREISSERTYQTNFLVDPMVQFTLSYFFSKQ